MHLNNESIILTLLMQYLSKQDLRLLDKFSGGNYYTNKGGGTNYLCLPNDPDNGKPWSYANDVLYGGEYETFPKTSGLDKFFID
jgi:hypothetical protein